MKKFIKRFWGVGLIVIILSSLFVSAAPVSAAEALRWEGKVGGPSTLFGVVGTAVVYDFAMSADTKTVYAACGTKLMQSTNGGASSWTDIASRLPAGHDSIRFVAMAPDDVNTVVVMSTNASVGYYTAISVNGGVTFTDTVMTSNTTTVLYGLEVSPLVTGGFRYITAYGQSNTADEAVIYYFNYGSGVGAWRNAVTYFTTKPADYLTMDKVLALAFSPNFASDYMAMAVSMTNNSTFNGTKLHALTFNISGTFTGGWDTAIASGYPVTLGATTPTAVNLASGSVALGPDFMGGDETLRIAFVGLASATYDAAIDGIWRCNDTAAARHIYADVGINSVAYDGTNLVAGAYISNNAYHSSDPLASTPTVTGARSFKRIGVDDAGNDLVRVMYVGETVFGSKQGKGGAISKSVDDGNTWNDFTLLNMSLTNIDDVMPSADGATWYVAIRDANISTVFRMSPMQRVLCTDEAVASYDYKLRGSPSDANVVYAFDAGGTTLFYSSDGGVSRWQQRLNVPAAIADLAVESANVIYFGNSVNIYKSINNGFTWNVPVNTTANSGTIYNMVTLGENKLLIVTTTGQALFSKDGGATWTRGGPGVPPGATTALVAATGLETGNVIFVAAGNSNAVYRCEIGPSNPIYEFKTMNLAAATATETTTGMVYVGGVLYAVSTYTTGETYLNSLLTPTMNPGGYVPTNAWRTRYNSSGFSANITLGQVPNSLTYSTKTGQITLWSIDTSGAMGVKYFDDTLALTGPKVTAPNDKALVQVNSVTGLPMSLVLLWDRPSLATSYDIWVSTDTNFTTIFDSSTGYTGVDGTRAQMSTVLGTGGSSTYSPGATYYWKVRANSPITSAWSETRSFTIQPLAAPVPVVASPANGATITNQSPAFSWTPVTSTTQYEFQLATTPTFGTTVLTDTPASAGTLVPVTIKLEQGKQYFWRVRALQPVQGDWSAVANFVVAAAPAPAPTTSVVVTQVPAPTITIPAASPVPAITLKPADVQQIAPTYIWAIIIIGAILVIAVIVLIVRTRRSV